MNDIGDMLTKAVEGVTRQFNAQVEASIAMLVNLGIPLERIELINHTTADLGVVTEVRSRTSDEAQAVAIERKAIAVWLDTKAIETTPLGMSIIKHAAKAIRNGEHVKP